MNEQLLRKFESGEISTAAELRRIKEDAEFVELQNESNRRKNVRVAADHRRENREQKINDLVEFDREAEEIRAEHNRIFQEREDFLKKSARLEIELRNRWYEKFIQFSGLFRGIGDGETDLETELKSRGAKLDAVRENLIYLPPSAVLNGLILTGEFRERESTEAK
jgi:hypothetical protein